MDAKQPQRILLKAENIYKSYHHPLYVELLQNINLEVFDGESAAIVGRSGEGKSTLLQILGTLEDACKGSLTIANHPVSNANKSLIRNQLIGFVFQSFHLLEDYSALENVLMPAKIARQKFDKSLQEHGLNLLEQVGLADRAHFSTKLLSGGEKQRVALARALCNNPRIIFADEPSGNLDSHTAEIIHQLLLNFVQKDKALILVTHDWDLAKLCTKRYELKKQTLISC